MNQVQMRQIAVGRWRVGGWVTGVIRFLVNAKGLQLRGVQIDNLKRLLGTRRVYAGEGRLRKRWIDTVKDYLKKNEFWMSGKKGEWCMVGVNGGL